MKQKLFVLSTILCMVIVGCKKDAATGKSKTQLLTQADWILQAVTYTTSLSATVKDNYANLPSCSKDDHFIFRVNKTYEQNEQTAKCSSAQIVETGTWSFSSDETVLTVNGSVSVYVATIKSLTENSLVISYSDIANVVTYYYTETFSH